MKLFTVILENYDNERCKRVKVLAADADTAMWQGAFIANGNRHILGGWQAVGVE